MSDREQFSSRIGFVLAAAGSAVGIGNLVGFPVNAAKSGGAVFLLIYAVFVALICLPVMIAEMSLGRKTRLGPVGAYKSMATNNKLWNIGGILGVITPFMIAVFYQVITVWIFGYLWLVITGDLAKLADPGFFGSFINDPTIFIYMVLVLVIIAAVLSKGVQEGIERVAKILMPMLFVMLIGLVIFVLTLDNAFSGVTFYLVPDATKITPAVVSNALSQAFFSLSLGMGILITYGSYINRKESISKGAKWVALTDTSVAFFAGLLILPAIFAFNPQIDASELSDSSVTLIFSFLPKIFVALQGTVGHFGASLFAGLFFLAVLFAALTSQISILQVPLAALEDQFKWPKGKSLLVLGIVGGTFTVACTLSFGMVDFLTAFATYGDQSKSFFDVVIDVFYDTILPLNGFIICLFVVFKWKRSQMNAELEVGDEDYQGSFYQRYVNTSLGTFIPIILLLVFINTVCIKFFSFSLTDFL